MNPRSKKHPASGVLLPVDFALLEILPDEGQMLGLKPIALQVGSIKNRTEFNEFSGNQIAGRLKALQFQGFATTQVTLPVQGGLGWQRTKAGKEVMERNGRTSKP